jgi:dynein assembly factor 5, axonemal
MDKLIDLIVKSDYLLSENTEVLECTMRITNNIVFAAGVKSSKPRQHLLFKLLLQLGSSELLKNHKGQVDETLELLAKNCGLQDASDLFSCELESLLLEMKEDYENWEKHTPERFIFDMLVRRSETAVVDYWDNILEIVAANVGHDKDWEVRMDMLSLIEHLMLMESLQSTIVFYTEIIVKLVLLPCCEWRSGMPNTAIRKAAVVCLIKIMEQSLIEKDKLQPMFPEIVNKMKNCLEDDWANDLRFSAVVFLKKLIGYLQDEMDREDYITIYPELLKRLDDAQDGIRIESTHALEQFFEKLPDPWSSSLYEYTIKAVFIHLDDPSTEIQKRITSVLEKGSRVQTEDFLRIADECLSKHSHPVLVKNLIDYANTNHK